MASHKFRTGKLAKKKVNIKDLYSIVHSLTPAQSSFFKEACMQLLGAEPSAFWGRSRIWFKIPNVDKKALLYLAEALNHAPHVTSDKLSRNTKAGGSFASIAAKVGEGVEEAAKFAAKGAKWAAEHGKQILGVIQKVSQGVDVAEGMGVLKQDSAIGKANDLFKMVSGASGSGFHVRDRRVQKKPRSF
jgi:hypothetical protein